MSNRNLRLFVDSPPDHHVEKSHTKLLVSERRIQYNTHLCEFLRHGFVSTPWNSGFDGSR